MQPTSHGETPSPNQQIVDDLIASLRIHGNGEDDEESDLESRSTFSSPLGTNGGGGDGEGAVSSSGSGSMASGINSDPFGTKRNAQDESLAIAKKENVAVFRIRLMVFIVLLAFTVGVTALVFAYTRGQEVKAFDEEFTDLSNKVLEAIGATLDLRLGALDSHVVGMVSYSEYSNSTWPYVTVPDFGARMAKLRSLTQTVSVTQYGIVTNDIDRREWQKYAEQNSQWVQKNIEIQATDVTYTGVNPPKDFFLDTPPHMYATDGKEVLYATQPYYPSWQSYPTIQSRPPYNFDASSSIQMKYDFETLIADHQPVLSRVQNLEEEVHEDDSDVEGHHHDHDHEEEEEEDDDGPQYDLIYDVNDLLEDYTGASQAWATEPVSNIYYPIYEGANEIISIEAGHHDDDHEEGGHDDNDHSGHDHRSLAGDEDHSDHEVNVLGIVSMTFYWRDLITNILPHGSSGLLVVIENECDQAFTYQVNGENVKYIGPFDSHVSKYVGMEFFSGINKLNDFATNRKFTGLSFSKTSCPYSIHTHPTQDMDDRFLTNNPYIYSAITVLIFFLTSLAFFFYDVLVERRQNKVMKTAVQSSAIVSSLFPSNVRNRLFEEEGNASTRSNSLPQPQKHRLKTFLNTGKESSNTTVTEATTENKGIGGSGPLARRSTMGRPIADLFPAATVMFADIAGFTAWSSIREPSQVFILLETLYGAYDKIALRRGVFKVETIGDSYVAVAGLPEARSDHAVVMAKFARDCQIYMNEVARDLRVTLGPDTEDLAMRLGLHSGPVIAGVLRGQKSRFQLFGDTVNTASRMESTSMRNRIQVSQATADCLLKAGKKHWIVPRKDTIEVKGKGLMQTYWVEPKTALSSRAESEESSSFSLQEERNDRHTDWNTDVLSQLVYQILALRDSRSTKVNTPSTIPSSNKAPESISWTKFDVEKKMVLEEVKEVIELPDFDANTANAVINLNPTSVHDHDMPLWKEQLRDYVVEISHRYRVNPFHNFEHASHVGMSVAKLMSRIVAADDVYDGKPMDGATSIASSKHDHTYGITSDPLTQFACVFSALIHDVEHPGVPNTQLVKEEDPIAKRYHGRSVAEQNSVAIAWELLMQPEYSAFRQAICSTTEEQKRFRQLVVNCVMATDIMDKELKTLRNERWDRAFHNHQNDENNMEEKHDNEKSAALLEHRTNVNRKATIVIEHLIQASDVAHTMQHWHIYRKWNERLFEEMYIAYKNDRSEKNPVDFWYQGELGFFDFYIIPLAKKLSECGVFGVSSDEYLNYARKNREEWERKGKAIIASMIKKLGAKETPVQIV